MFRTIFSLFLMCIMGTLGCNSGSDAVAPAQGQNGCITNGQQICGGLCINVLSDPLNCGMCERRCPDGYSCVDGMCGVVGCGMNAGEALCGGECVNLQENPQHCGGCNRECGESANCVEGMCMCNEGLDYCLNTCVNLQSDLQHCGQCGRACSETQSCFEGECREAREEYCNQVDDDLDGRVDEDEQGRILTQDCSNLCGEGVRECIKGEFENCSAPPSETEVCDGFDNDCDGLVDEDVSTTYFEDRDGDGHGALDFSTAIISCRPPTQRGPNGGEYVTSNRDCNDNNNLMYPMAIEMCDDVDNNCDGTVDEGCTCTNGDSRTCGREEGECTLGTQLCMNGEYGSCVDGILPVEEICNERDDDCDGTVDESLEGDRYEPNQVCDQAFELPPSHNNEASQIIDRLTLYEGTGLLDTDWFKFRTTDARGICTPGRAQCLQFTLDWILPQGQSPSDFDLCIHSLEDLDNACRATEVECSSASERWQYNEEQRTYSFTHQWSGTCLIDDSLYWALEVKSLVSLNSCRPYTVRLRTELMNESCSE